MLYLNIFFAFLGLYVKIGFTTKTGPDRAGPSRTGPDRTDIGPSPGMNEHPIRAMKMIFTSIDTPFNFLPFGMVKPSK